MLCRRWLAAVVILGGGCSPERTQPMDASPLDPPALPAASPPDQVRLERLARRMAVALGNQGLRQQLRQSLSRSPYRENKLQLQQVLHQSDGQLLREVARENGEGEGLIEEDLEAAGSLEIYLPVAEHRASWSGTDDILVATSMRDGDAPIAFDVRGRRIELDRALPPAVPVLSLVPAELDFSRGPAQAMCTPETCPPSDGGGDVPAAPHGIYLTQATISDLKEDWLRGSPEVEAMFMGPLTDTTKMALVACANESSAAPRYYNQDKTFWTGDVLVADSTQLERVRAAYPPGTPWNMVRFTVAFWEDDTGRCQIAYGVSSWTNKLIAAGLTVLGGMVVLATDWSQPIATEAWPFIVQLPLGLLGLIGSIGGDDDFLGNAVNRTVWNPLHPDDIVSTNQVILDGNVRNGNATIVWR